MASTVQDFYTTLTRQGTSAILQAGTLGPRIEITGFRIGTLSAAQGAVADPAATDVDDFVYAGNASQISYQILQDSDSCMFSILLDETVGDFDVGQIGLMVGATMFSKSVLYRREPKWKSALPGRFGNRITLNLILTIASIESCINLTLLRSSTSSLPFVETEIDLPLPAATVFNAYVVRNHTKTGNPAIAVKRNNVWSYSTAYATAGNGSGVIPVGNAAFDASVKINHSVYYNPANNTYFRADSSDPLRAPVGVRTSLFEITTLGRVARYVPDDIWPTLTPGELYSTGSAGSAGVPVAVNNGHPYGYVLDNNSMFVDFSAMFYRNVLQNNVAGVVRSTLPVDYTHNHPAATATDPGFLIPADKAKLDSITINQISIIP